MQGVLQEMKEFARKSRHGQKKKLPALSLLFSSRAFHGKDGLTELTIIIHQCLPHGFNRIQID